MFAIGDRVRNLEEYEAVPGIFIKSGWVGTIQEESDIPFVFWDNIKEEWAQYEYLLEYMDNPVASIDAH